MNDVNDVNDVNDTRPRSAERVPTLTEVVELGLLEPDPSRLPELPLLFAELQNGPQNEAQKTATDPPTPRLAARTPATHDAQTLVALVLAELSPRIDALFETRLREALAPALARAAEGLIRDASSELSATLRALVEETVAQALRRQDPN